MCNNLPDNTYILIFRIRFSEIDLNILIVKQQILFSLCVV